MSEGRSGFIGSILRKMHEISPVDKWQDNRGDWLMDSSKVREYLRPMIKEKAEKIKVLSVGAGEGHEIDWLDSVLEGVDVVGLDPNNFWTEPVQKRLNTPDKFGNNTAKYLSPEVMADNLTGVEDGSMDAVTIFFVLHHMNKEKHGKVLQELNRVLKVGGLVFAGEDIVDSEEEKDITEREDRLLNLEFFTHDSHDYRSAQEWEDLFSKHGFQIKEYNEVKPKKVRNGFFVLEKVDNSYQEK